ncbi:hypothetical protein GOP47_0006606 [Adiantum capillus-veneris]|uniref:Uncharacterized protein n=1 Tax=Adiantum capillus-veneris TaxID=13818 RepID=A0A9D4V3R7_ADICA|nr:hypothetical protein GOP47_0006606 [Adiantum capillus-veneris]
MAKVTCDRESDIEDLIQTVDACTEQFDAKRLELLFDISEIRYALSKLGNGKTPGICGISKEFVVAFGMSSRTSSCV